MILMNDNSLVLLCLLFVDVVRENGRSLSEQ